MFKRNVNGNKTMYNYKGKVIVRYLSNSKEKLPTVYANFQGKSVLVDENYIKSRLKTLFEQSIIKIDEVIIGIEIVQESQGNKYECHASIVSPDINFNIQRANTNYDNLIHNIIEKCVEYVHKAKEKKLHSK